MGWKGEKHRHSLSARGIKTNKLYDRVVKVKEEYKTKLSHLLDEIEDEFESIPGVQRAIITLLDDDTFKIEIIFMDLLFKDEYISYTQFITETDEFTQDFTNDVYERSKDYIVEEGKWVYIKHETTPEEWLEKNEPHVYQDINDMAWQSVIDGWQFHNYMWDDYMEYIIDDIEDKMSKHLGDELILKVMTVNEHNNEYLSVDWLEGEHIKPEDVTKVKNQVKMIIDAYGIVPMDTGDK